MRDEESVLKERGEIAVMKEIAEKVLKIHERGITHNNIKFSNIYFVEKSIKFGIPYLLSIEKCQRRNYLSLQPSEESLKAP